MSKENAIAPKFVSPSGAKDYLGCSLSTIWRLIRRGELKSYKLMSSTRIKISELDEYMESQAYEYS